MSPFVFDNPAAWQMSCSPKVTFLILRPILLCPGKFQLGRSIAMYRDWCLMRRWSKQMPCLVRTLLQIYFCLLRLIQTIFLCPFLIFTSNFHGEHSSLLKVLLSTKDAVCTFIPVLHRCGPLVLIPLCIVLPEVRASHNSPDKMGSKIKMVFFFSVVKAFKALELLTNLVCWVEISQKGFVLLAWSP